jgi:hypothetical protein
MPKTISNQNITLFVSVDEYGKIAGSIQKKRFRNLVLEKTTKQLIQTVISKIRKY